MNRYSIGICGIGFVGGAMMKSFIEKGYILNKNLFIYDKYKDGGIGSFNSLLNSDILFLALPTLYDEKTKTYNLEPLEETLEKLSFHKFENLVVIKSTILPSTLNKFALKYNLNLVHNPEFLTARTAFYDFHNQSHIVLGKQDNCNDEKFKQLINFYKENYPKATISICHSTEAEAMKLFLNAYYATKVQFFTELYLLSQKLGVNYDNVRDLMLKNGWINKMHTNIPGHDGKISYGGACFPKDTNALLNFMVKLNSPSNVLKSVIEERNNMRTD